MILLAITSSDSLYPPRMIPIISADMQMGLLCVLYGDLHLYLSSILFGMINQLIRASIWMGICKSCLYSDYLCISIFRSNSYIYFLYIYTYVDTRITAFHHVRNGETYSS